MKNEQAFFNSSKDGNKTFYQYWLNREPGTPGRTLVIQHGFGEHSGRYENLVNQLKGTDFNIYALDSRGHGRSDGKRGHVKQFQLYIDDLAELIHIAREKEKVQKLILLGHSLGGVIALQYAVEGSNQDNLHAIVIASPALKVKMDFSKKIKKGAALVLSKFFPATTLDANLDLKFLSHDQEVIENYKKDPLVHGQISFQMATNLFNLSRAIRHNARIIKIPILIIHGEMDNITDIAGSRELYENLEIKEREFHTYPNLFHELMNESLPDRTKVLKDIHQFFDTYIPPK